MHKPLLPLGSAFFGHFFLAPIVVILAFFYFFKIFLKKRVKVFKVQFFDQNRVLETPNSLSPFLRTCVPTSLIRARATRGARFLVHLLLFF